MPAHQADKRQRGTSTTANFGFSTYRQRRFRRATSLALPASIARLSSRVDLGATLLELKNENSFKVRAYTNAARAIETFGANLSSFQDEEAVAKIPGIGKSIALKIKELAEGMI